MSKREVRVPAGIEVPETSLLARVTTGDGMDVARFHQAASKAKLPRAVAQRTEVLSGLPIALDDLIQCCRCVADSNVDQLFDRTNDNESLRK